MLTDAQCAAIDRILRTRAEPRSTAAYLCLHMGLTLAEVGGLRLADINLAGDILTLRQKLTRDGNTEKTAPLQAERTLLLPPDVSEHLSAVSELYPKGSCYIMSGTEAPAPFYVMRNLLGSVASELGLNEPLSSGDLRDAFIRRALRNGADIYSICVYCGISRPETLFRKFGEYFTFRADRLLQPLSETSDAPEKPKGLRVIVLGAGKNRRGIGRIISAIGIFDEICFLGDKNDGSDAPVSDCVKKAGEYQAAIVCFADSRLRRMYTELAESLGYVVPSFRHSGAKIAASAVLGSSVMIGDGAVIGENAVIGRGAVIASGAIIEDGAVIGDFSDVGTAAVIERDTRIPACVSIPVGTVVHPHDYV